MIGFQRGAGIWLQGDARKTRHGGVDRVERPT